MGLASVHSECMSSRKWMKPLIENCESVKQSWLFMQVVVARKSQEREREKKKNYLRGPFQLLLWCFWTQLIFQGEFPSSLKVWKICPTHPTCLTIFKKCTFKTIACEKRSHSEESPTKTSHLKGLSFTFLCRSGGNQSKFTRGKINEKRW